MCFICTNAFAFLHKYYELGAIISVFFQVRKLRHRELSKIGKIMQLVNDRAEFEVKQSRPST